MPAWYAYKQATLKLSRSWLPTRQNTLVRMSVHSDCANPFLSRLLVMPSSVRRAFASIKASSSRSHGSRVSWARNTINSPREFPREWRRWKIFTSRTRPSGAHPHLLPWVFTVPAHPDLSPSAVLPSLSPRKVPIFPPSTLRFSKNSFIRGPKVFA